METDEPVDVRRTFKYRLYRLGGRPMLCQLSLEKRVGCTQNAAVQERRDAWRLQRKRVSFYDQSSQLKDIRAAGDVGIPNFNVACDVLHRVDRAFAGFFRRLAAGKGKAGFRGSGVEIATIPSRTVRSLTVSACCQ